MPRKTIDLSEEAYNIYLEWKPHDRSQKVSQAIIEKHERSQNEYTLEAKVEELERRIKVLEGK